MNMDDTQADVVACMNGEDNMTEMETTNLIQKLVPDIAHTVLAGESESAARMESYYGRSVVT